MPEYIITISQHLEYSMHINEDNMEEALFLFQSNSKPYPSARFNEIAKTTITITEAK